MKRKLSALLILLISMLFISVCAKVTRTGPQSVTVNGVRINYIEQGKGDEVIVFVHGYSGALGNWKKDAALRY